jgi:hypothetical protein
LQWDPKGQHQTQVTASIQSGVTHLLGMSYTKIRGRLRPPAATSLTPLFTICISSAESRSLPSRFTCTPAALKASTNPWLCLAGLLPLPFALMLPSPLLPLLPALSLLLLLLLLLLLVPV